MVWGELPTVWGDAVQLTQVFQILIEAHRAEDGWAIAVRDNGLGIAGRFHDMVFVPFKRLHGWEIPGTGIGLPLCRRVIKVHDGRIWVESEDGQGSFFFTLPLEPGAGSQ